MELAPPADDDTTARIVAWEGAKWFYEITDTVPGSLAEVLHLTAEIEHALTNGQTVAFDCRNTLSKTVRG